MSQPAHVQQRYEPDDAAAHMRTGSAPDMVDAPIDGSGGDAQHTSAFDRLSDLPPGAVTSISFAQGRIMQAWGLHRAVQGLSLAAGSSLTCSIDCGVVPLQRCRCRAPCQQDCHSSSSSRSSSSSSHSSLCLRALMAALQQQMVWHTNTSHTSSISSSSRTAVCGTACQGRSPRRRQRPTATSGGGSVPLPASSSSSSSSSGQAVSMVRRSLSASALPCLSFDRVLCCPACTNHTSEHLCGNVIQWNSHLDPKTR